MTRFDGPCRDQRPAPLRKSAGRGAVMSDVAMKRVETKEQVPLFGSFVRAAAGPESDVDLLVEFDPARKSFDNLLALADLLESTLGRRVEIVTTAALSPYVGPHILKEAEDVIRAA